MIKNAYSAAEEPICRFQVQAICNIPPVALEDTTPLLVFPLGWRSFSTKGYEKLRFILETGLLFESHAIKPKGELRYDMTTVRFCFSRDPFKITKDLLVSLLERLPGGSPAHKFLLEKEHILGTASYYPSSISLSKVRRAVRKWKPGHFTLHPSQVILYLYDDQGNLVDTSLISFRD